MNRHFFEEDIQINLAHGRTHIIISHQENANQNNNEILLYTHQDGPNTTLTTVGRVMEKLEPSYTC